MFYVAKAKRQLQKSPASIGGEMNAVLSHFSAGIQSLRFRHIRHLLKEVKASG
jgi:hypothetical protein